MVRGYDVDLFPSEEDRGGRAEGSISSPSCSRIMIGGVLMLVDERREWRREICKVSKEGLPRRW